MKQTHDLIKRSLCATLTKASRLPTNLLYRADLPTLGRPTIATCKFEIVHAPGDLRRAMCVLQNERVGEPEAERDRLALPSP